MIHFERTTDLDLVKRVFTHPKIFRLISDDFTFPPERFQPIDHPAVWYIAAYDDRELLGIWMLHPHNRICWECHTALLPIAWGPRAKQCGQQAIAWVWQQTECQRIITNVPASNRLALRYALACGFQQFGVNEKSFMKHGKLEDQILLGISRPEALSPCQRQ